MDKKLLELIIEYGRQRYNLGLAEAYKHEGRDEYHEAAQKAKQEILDYVEDLKK